MEYSNTPGTYTVPVSGYYQISATITYYIPTGEYERILNPDKKWYEFWEPKFITREIFKIEHRENGTQIKFLEAGEKVELPEENPFIFRLK